MSEYFHRYFPSRLVLEPRFATFGTVSGLGVLATEEHATFVTSMDAVIR
jgi:hypothetical protein